MIVTLFQNGSVEILSNIKTFQPRILAPLTNEDVYVLQLILPSSIDTNGLLLLDDSLNDVPIIKRVTTLQRESPLTEFYFERKVFETLQAHLLSLNIRYFDNIPLTWNVSYIARLNEDGSAIDYLKGIVHVMNSGDKDIGPASLHLVVKKLQRIQPSFVFPAPSHVTYQRQSQSRSRAMPRGAAAAATEMQQLYGGQQQQATFASIGDEEEEEEKELKLAVSPQMEAVGEGSKVELPDPLLLQKQTMTDVLILYVEGCELKKIHSWSLDNQGTGERHGSATVTYAFRIEPQRNTEGVLPGGILSLYSFHMNFLDDFSIPRLLFSKPVVLKGQEDDHVQVKSFFRIETIENPIQTDQNNQYEDNDNNNDNNDNEVVYYSKHKPKFRKMKKSEKSEIVRIYYHYTGSAVIENHHQTPIQIRLDFQVQTPRVQTLFLEGAQSRMDMTKSRVELMVQVPAQSLKNVKFEFVSLPAEL